MILSPKSVNKQQLIVAVSIINRVINNTYEGVQSSKPEVRKMVENRTVCFCPFSPQSRMNLFDL